MFAKAIGHTLQNAQPKPQTAFSEREVRTYACQQIVFRAAIYPNWIKRDGTVRKQAFNRRQPPADRSGLSCSPTEDHCRDGLTLPTYGTITVHVGWIRDLKLDVIPDSMTHANIVGVPDRDEDPAPHDFLASELAKIARSLAEPIVSDDEISN
jgi:hypothetical protein